MSEFILPKKPIKAISKSPANLVIFSKIKVGKTSNLLQLPKSLLIDLEKGSSYFDGVKLVASNVSDILKIGKMILAEKAETGQNPYDYLILDTLSGLERMCENYAETLYSRKAIGKSWFKKDATGAYTKDSGKVQYGNILNMPNGAGYAFLREAMTNIIEYVKTLAPRVIFTCHLKSVLTDKGGAEFNSSEIDLVGKTKNIISSQSDAIGYLYRSTDNQNILSFLTTDAITCGARPVHLRNKEIILSELITDEKTQQEVLKTYWDRIYID